MSEDTKQCFIWATTLSTIIVCLIITIGVYNHHYKLQETERLRIEKGGIECSELYQNQ